MALEREPGFRHLVAGAWRAVHPELAEAVDDGQVPELAAPRVLAAGFYLLRPGGWEEILALLAGTLAEAEAHRLREEQETAADDLLQQTRAEADRARDEAAQAREEAAALQQELTGLRREVRRMRADADRARAEARTARAEADERLAAARQREDALESTLSQAEERVREATREVEQARRAGREGRSLGDARARLLLDTIVEAATGLRRELALPPAAVLPADLVVAPEAPASPAESVGPRAHAPEDPATLDRLLGLPRVHLLVDGYNVTKEGYGTLPLIEQRRRLQDGLAVLLARTGAEVTCCFDGADVDRSPTTRHRGVRVVFSEPGTTADDLIRRLVRAEPPGRVVVVVSSDGEVASGVRAAGARAVPSTALLRLLGRG